MRIQRQAEQFKQSETEEPTEEVAEDLPEGSEVDETRVDSTDAFLAEDAKTSRRKIGGEGRDGFRKDVTPKEMEGGQSVFGAKQVAPGIVAVISGHRFSDSFWVDFKEGSLDETTDVSSFAMLPTGTNYMGYTSPASVQLLPNVGVGSKSEHPVDELLAKTDRVVKSKKFQAYSQAVDEGRTSEYIKEFYENPKVEETLKAFSEKKGWGKPKGTYADEMIGFELGQYHKNKPENKPETPDETSADSGADSEGGEKTDENGETLHVGDSVSGTNSAGEEISGEITGWSFGKPVVDGRQVSDAKKQSFFLDRFNAGRTVQRHASSIHQPHRMSSFSDTDRDKALQEAGYSPVAVGQSGYWSQDSVSNDWELTVGGGDLLLTVQTDGQILESGAGSVAGRPTTSSVKIAGNWVLEDDGRNENLWTLNDSDGEMLGQVGEPGDEEGDEFHEGEFFYWNESTDEQGWAPTVDAAKRALEQQVGQ